jgi:outer membrane protein
MRTIIRGGLLMRTLAMICAMVVVLTASVAAASEKTAYVDTQAVFEKTSLGKKYQGIVREYYESRKKILDVDAEEIQKLKDDYDKQKQAKALNEKAQKAKEETIGRKINDFQKKREEFSTEIGKKNEELSLEFNQKMMVVVKAIAKKQNISMVLAKSITIMAKTEIQTVLYAEEDLDLTEKVIAEMDKKESAK